MGIEAIGCNSEISGKASANESQDSEEKIFKRHFLSVNGINENDSILFLLGDYREEGIPDPIPNSEVKLFIADGTTRKSVGE